MVNTNEIQQDCKDNLFSFSNKINLPNGQWFIKLYYQDKYGNIKGPVYEIYQFSVKDSLLTDTLRVFNKHWGIIKLSCYNFGRLNGINKEFWPNGIVSKEYYCHNGNSYQVLLYYENGMPEEREIEIDTDREAKQILVTKWYNNGFKKEEGIKRKIRTENQRLEEKAGNWKYWESNGKLLKEENYEEGVKDGDQHYWDKDGRDLKIEYYKNGKLKRTLKFLIPGSGLTPIV